MENPDEPRTVVCMRLVDAPIESTVVGASRDTCESCQAAVWVAPSTRTLISTNPDVCFHFACTTCAVKLMEETMAKDPDMPLKIERVPGQLEELFKAMQHIAQASNN